jgi:hypothetical protein
MKMFNNFYAEVRREDILNQKLRNKTYMKLVIMMEGKVVNCAISRKQFRSIIFSYHSIHEVRF